ncbi:MAG: spore germination protein [Clostridiales bacterium]|nr:spore germination protein [Clostridiales bacterium]
MFKVIARIIKSLQKENPAGPSSVSLQGSKKSMAEKIPANIKDVKAKIRREFDRCEDLVIRALEIGENNFITMLVVYIDGMVDKQILNSHVLRPLLIDARTAPLAKTADKRTIVNIIERNLLDNCEVLELTDYKQSVDKILSGDTVLYIDGCDIALATCTKGFPLRNVEEPDTESNVRGPREGFVESFRINTSLIRKRIKSPALKIEEMTIGRQTNTKVGIVYVEGIADRNVVEEVKKRLFSIDIDGVLESGMLEELIMDSPLSPIPTIANSEKPDKIAGKLLEGRVAIITDGTPFVLTVPNLFIEAFQSNEDYYSLPFFSSLIRILRYAAFAISVYGPALYVAMLGFHQSVIPFRLVATIAAARQGLPFDSFTEAFIMGIAFELLREAGVRMPKPVGQAVSIVGALVLGEASIRAGIAGAPMVIITAITAICGFILTPYYSFMPIARFFLLVSAQVLGLLGISLVTAAGLIHLCSLRSFGVPFMAPLAPLNLSDLKDTIIRAPLWTMLKRPKTLTGIQEYQNRARMTPIQSFEDYDENEHN